MALEVPIKEFHDELDDFWTSPRPIKQPFFLAIVQTQLVGQVTHDDVEQDIDRGNHIKWDEHDATREVLSLL